MERDHPALLREPQGRAGTAPQEPPEAAVPTPNAGNGTNNGTGSKERCSHIFHCGSAASSPGFTQMPALTLHTMTASNSFSPHQKKTSFFGEHIQHKKDFCPLLCKNNRPSSEPLLCSIQLSHPGAALSSRAFPSLTFLMYRRNVHMSVTLLNICRIKLSITSNNFRVTVTVAANNYISAVTTHTHITTRILRAFKPILFSLYFQ